MSENTIFIRNFLTSEMLDINEREVYRYSGYLGLGENVDSELKSIFEQVKDELKNAFSYKVCYRRMEIKWEKDLPVLPFASESQNLAKCLNGSSEMIIFAATIGLDIDRHIAKQQRFSPTKALLMQAYGAERVESLCDLFCKEISETVWKEGKTITNRFSPGYGDLPLEVQKDFFRLLDCNRKIGISLNESLLMTPSKSVTAILGIKDCNESGSKDNINTINKKCHSCDNINCEYRCV